MDRLVAVRARASWVGDFKFYDSNCWIFLLNENAILLLFNFFHSYLMRNSCCFGEFSVVLRLTTIAFDWMKIATKWAAYKILQHHRSTQFRSLHLWCNFLFHIFRLFSMRSCIVIKFRMSYCIQYHIIVDANKHNENISIISNAFSFAHSVVQRFCHNVRAIRIRQNNSRIIAEPSS